ncbi:MAG: hypothetical protein H6828_00365 [Planctomycetes bacterium]|nr:hypothetical protein [Planctomycetota bacterium]
MSSSLRHAPVLSAALVLSLGGEALAFQTQFTYSVAYKGPIVSQTAAGTAVPITEADVLTFGPGQPGFGPLQAPALALGGDQFGLVNYTLCAGHVGGTPCGIEIDGISQGRDEPLSLAGLLPAGKDLWFSVDEWAKGHPALGPAPTVLSESGAVGDSSADVYVAYTLTAGPLPPGSPAGRHVAVFDGNGLPSAQPSGKVYVGIGLVEPNAPAPGLPNRGDDVDALDLGALVGFPPTGYFISLDSAFLDPLEGVPNSGSAATMGFSGADVLLVPAPGTAPTLYAPAALLGLDLVAGPGSDDVDALILAENGDNVFQASHVPYDWGMGGSDMLLFSVRRGSAVIGRPDSIFGVPIEEGDVLTTPLPTAMGGLSPFPGIFWAAETLGLRTARTHGETFGDDLNAMDLVAAKCFDCNNNGVEDSVDINTGGSADTNNNGIPDECEKITKYCTCPAGAPCGNTDPGAGCSNSTGVGSDLYFTGTSSVVADDLALHVTDLPVNKWGVVYMGGAQISVPFGDGLRCVGAGASGVYRFPPQNSGALGAVDFPPPAFGGGVVSYAASLFPPAGQIGAGSTWYLQFWYRDPVGPCGNVFNLSSAMQVDFVP